MRILTFRYSSALYNKKYFIFFPVWSTEKYSLYAIVVSVSLIISMVTEFQGMETF